MALLDDFRGKEQIRRLNDQLSVKGTEISNLQSRLVEMSQQYRDSDAEVARLTTVASDNEAVIATLRHVSEQADVAHGHLVREFDLLKQAELERQAHAIAVIEDLNKRLSDVAPEIVRIRAEREKTLDEVRQLKGSLANSEREYLARESKLQEGITRLKDGDIKLAAELEKLRHDRQKFQQQTINFFTREQHWKTVIEPQLRKYEAHCDFDSREIKIKSDEALLADRERELNVREGDLEQRQCTDANLRARSVEIDEWRKLLSDEDVRLQSLTAEANNKQEKYIEKESGLIAWAAELSAFQLRVAGLDKDVASLNEREKMFEVRESEKAANHKTRLSEIKSERVALKALKSQLCEYEQSVKQREIEVKSEEARQLNLKNKNFALRQDVKRLSELLNTCEETQIEAAGVNATLQDENVTLKARIAGLVKAAGQIKDATKPKGSSEVEIDGYDPVKHGGEIAPPPPAFRSNTPLTALHYHVGLSGIEDEDERRDLLRSIIVCSFRQLPKVGSPEYMRQWGEGKSPQRVRCIAYHLSWNIGFQGAKGTNELARQHWLDDLKWLTRCYKAKIPASRWPSVPRA